MWFFVKVNSTGCFSLKFPRADPTQHKYIGLKLRQTSDNPSSLKLRAWVHYQREISTFLEHDHATFVDTATTLAYFVEEAYEPSCSCDNFNFQLCVSHPFKTITMLSNSHLVCLFYWLQLGIAMWCLGFKKAQGASRGFTVLGGQASNTIIIYLLNVITITILKTFFVTWIANLVIKDKIVVAEAFPPESLNFVVGLFIFLKPEDYLLYKGFHQICLPQRSSLFCKIYSK
ncbi:hypothetical protein DVH24_035542 [Malus domestica]|uniref:Uncharacterized protein n=1 Tax=Malus domestica TaxID=3750 RepID=A0A498J574_MALDO|nr:hypothetical protein DVH24_035542 [Malus domestica]